jgi:hypothetical protein
MGQVFRANIISERWLFLSGVQVYGCRVFGRRGKSVRVFNEAKFEMV